MPLATVDDIATRLGRDLTAAEQAFATQTIESVTAQIALATNKTVAYLDALSPPSKVLTTLCVEKVSPASPSHLARTVIPRRSLGSSMVWGHS
jgi:hypothetical protein